MKVLNVLLFLLVKYVNSHFIETEIRSSSCLGSLSFHHYHTDEVITKVTNTIFRVTLSNGRKKVKMRVEGNCCFYVFNKEKCRGEIRKPLNTDTVKSTKQGGKISVVKMDTLGHGCKANQTVVRNICKERMNRFRSLKRSSKSASQELLVGNLLNKAEGNLRLDESIVKTYSNMEQDVTDVADPKIYIRKDEKVKVKIVGESHMDIVNKTEQAKFNITEDLDLKSIYGLKEKELKKSKDLIENILNNTEEEEVKKVDEFAYDIHTKTKEEALINKVTEALPLADSIENMLGQSNDISNAVDKYEQSKLTILDEIGSVNVTSTVDVIQTEIDSTKATNMEPTIATTLNPELITTNTIDVYTKITEITTMKSKDVKHKAIEMSTMKRTEVKYETTEMIKVENTDVNYETTEMAIMERTDKNNDIKELTTMDSTDVNHETTVMDILEDMDITHESIEIITMESVDAKTNDDEQFLIENNNLKDKDEESSIMKSKDQKTGIPGISTMETTHLKTEEEETTAETEDTSSMDITDMKTKEPEISTKDVSDISTINLKTAAKTEDASETSAKNITGANNVNPQIFIKETKVLKSKVLATSARDTIDINPKIPPNLKILIEETLGTNASKTIIEETTIVKTTDVKQPMIKTTILHAIDKPAVETNVEKIATNKDIKYKQKINYKENRDADSTEGYFIRKNYNEASALIKNYKNKETQYLSEKTIGINIGINDTFNKLKREEDDIVGKNRATRAETKHGSNEVVKHRNTFANTTLRKYTRIDQTVVSGTEEMVPDVNWNIEFFHPAQTNHDTSYDTLINQTNHDSSYDSLMNQTNHDSSYDSLINQTSKILENNGTDLNYTNNSEEAFSGRKRSSTDKTVQYSTDKTETVIYKFDKPQSYTSSSSLCCKTFSNSSGIQLLFSFSIFLMQYYYK